MDVQGMSLVLYIYTLDGGQIKVEKVRSHFLEGSKANNVIVVLSKSRVIEEVMHAIHNQVITKILTNNLLS